MKEQQLSLALVSSKLCIISVLIEKHPITCLPHYEIYDFNLDVLIHFLMTSLHSTFHSILISSLEVIKSIYVKVFSKTFLCPGKCYLQNMWWKTSFF